MINYENLEFTNVKIAILLAAYEGNNLYFKQQLDSIAEQSCQDFICFLHDDGSTDGTPQIIDKYCKAHSGKFISMGSHRCGGAKQNFFYMLEHVSADYIMFCDGDDVWLPEKIEKTLAAMQALEECGQDVPLCVYSDTKVVDADLKEIAPSYFKFMGKCGDANSWKELLKINVAVGHTMMINRKLQEEALKLDNQDNVFMHDGWCALLASLLGKIAYVKEPLSLYRQHGGNSVGAKGQMKWYLKWKKILSFKDWIASKKVLIDRPRGYAKELIKVIPKEDERYVLLKGLAEIENKNKFARISFYRKNDLFIPMGLKFIQVLFI